LTVFGGWRSFFISKKMQLLRVLDLEDTSDVSDDDLEQIVELLSRLKFLSLRGCTSVSRLPTSLGNLKHLETLDVRHTSISMLPQTITKLQKLQYIRAGSTRPKWPSTSIQPGSCRLPRGTGKMTALHTLGVVDVGAVGGNDIRKELSNLTQVRKLEVSGINVDNIKDFWSAIKAHRYLESLSVRFDMDKPTEIRFLHDTPEFVKTLRSLKVYLNGDTLPSWLYKLPCLRKMDLEISRLTLETNFLLRQVAFQSLRLCFKRTDLDEHEELTFRDCPLLQILEIDCSSWLLLCFERSMQSLELLKVRCSSGCRISGLADLKVLKQVCLLGFIDETLKQDVGRQIAKHPNESKPVLTLEEVSSR
jgi:Leucine-rich repeat (LRR) protein